MTVNNSNSPFRSLFLEFSTISQVSLLKFFIASLFIIETCVIWYLHYKCAVCSFVIDVAQKVVFFLVINLLFVFSIPKPKQTRHPFMKN